MAEQAGVSYADLNEIENGQVYGSIAKFRRLANCLHIPVYTIVTNDILGVPDSFFREVEPAAYLPPAKSKNAALGREGEETATKFTEAGYEYWIYVFSKVDSGDLRLEKVPFQNLLDEKRIEPVRYQCNIRPRPESENGILFGGISDKTGR